MSRVEDMVRVDEMGVYEVSRWYSLFEAVNFIADECDERNIDFESVRLEPLHMRKYIEKTCDIFARKLDEENAIAAKSAKELREASTLRG